jgi:hypothetical protein
MKTKLHSFTNQAIFWTTLIGLVLSTPLQAATNAPAAEVIRSNSSISRGLSLYSIRFPGGRVSDFFKFMRTNGFAGDTILFAGEARRVYIPEFTVSNVQLKEVAKSVEFVADNRIIVELIEPPLSGDANIWRIKPHDRAVSQIKTKACAVPNLLAGPKSRERVQEVFDHVERALAQGTETLYNNQELRPNGGTTIIDSEKIVVAVGTEAYVEAITSALEAAEKVAASVAEKKQAQ